jgi:hypothetical protein
VAGYYEAWPGGVFLSAERNRYRPQSHSRWDIRAIFPILPSVGITAEF